MNTHPKVPFPRHSTILCRYNKVLERNLACGGATASTCVCHVCVCVRVCTIT